MFSAAELGDWLDMFKHDDPAAHIQITCCGMVIAAQNKYGRHFFSLQGYAADDVDLLIDRIYTYI